MKGWTDLPVTGKLLFEFSGRSVKREICPAKASTSPADDLPHDASRQRRLRSATRRADVVRWKIRTDAKMTRALPFPIDNCQIDC